MTTYIESKLNPDGTYDHSEVIEAHKNSGIVQYSDFKGSWWPWISEYYLDNIKYRAVIEDKPSQRELDEQKQWEDWSNSDDLSDLVALKFQSDSAIPVERITLTRAEVNEVFPGLLK